MAFRLKRDQGFRALLQQADRDRRGNVGRSALTDAIRNHTVGFGDKESMFP